MTEKLFTGTLNRNQKQNNMALHVQDDLSKIDTGGEQKETLIKKDGRSFPSGG